MDRLTVFGQTEELRLQFILADYLSSSDQVALIEAEPLSDFIEEEGLSRLANGIATLVGGVIDADGMLPWEPSRGSLGKLRHLCQLYAPKGKKVQPLVADLRLIAVDAFHAALQAREMLHELRFPLDAKRQRAVHDQLRHLLGRLGRSISHVGEVLGQILLIVAPQEENLLYLIHRRRSECEVRLGREVIAALLTPERLAFVAEQYRTRGFDQIAQAIFVPCKS